MRQNDIDAINQLLEGVREDLSYTLNGHAKNALTKLTEAVQILTVGHDRRATNPQGFLKRLNDMGNRDVLFNKVLSEEHIQQAESYAGYRDCARSKGDAIDRYCAFDDINQDNKESTDQT